MMRWPWFMHSKDKRTITIVAPHQTPEGRKAKDAVFMISAIFGFYHFYSLRAAITPLAISIFSEKTPKEQDGFATLLAIAAITLGALLMVYVMLPIFYRRPLIIKMNPEQIRVWNIFWFITYDRERIGGFHLEQHEKAEIENRENHERAKKPRYIYRDSVQIFMDYNNMPVIITSIYGAMPGRMLLGRIQAIFAETARRQGDTHSTGKY